MNLIVLPFHDWRKVQREGERTRDAHLIRKLSESPEVDSLLIVNRPMSFVEMAYRRTWWKTAGTVVHADSRFRLVQVAPKAYVLDTIDKALVGPLVQGKRRFFAAYGSQRLLEAVDWNRIVLGMNDCCCVSFSIYAAQLFRKLECGSKHFDAWDNFLRFPSQAGMRHELLEAYKTYVLSAGTWSTNSEENRAYYAEELGLRKCTVIKNGVNPETFQDDRPVPADLARIPHPIAGMGLKVTHLLDTDLLNHLIWSNPGVSFVLIGQVLDREVFAKIKPAPNFHYLGDKHYRDYPAYVQNFDLCLIPYHTGNKQHGGDAIKFYEYLAANKPVVATRGNGVSDEYEAVWLADSPGEFSTSLQQALAHGPIRRELPHDLTWAHKSTQVLDLLMHTVKTERKCTAPVK